MRATKGDATIMGVGAAACAVCCAGPILGALAAIGLGTAAGMALFGTIALFVGAVAVGLVVVRRRRSSDACHPADAPAAVPVVITGAGSRC